MKYNAAALVECGVHPNLYADLTDRQIAEIYQHKRDEKTGQLKVPKLPPKRRTYVEDMMMFEETCNKFNVPMENRQKGIEAIMKKHGKV